MAHPVFQVQNILIGGLLVTEGDISRNACVVMYAGGKRPKIALFCNILMFNRKALLEILTVCL